MSDFDRAVEVILVQECGYNPGTGVRGDGYVSPDEAARKGDRGGETKFGICKRQYPDLDIANLTEDQAKDIYRRDYWAPVKGNQLPWPLNLFVFDAAVNQGVGAATNMLQAALGVAQDGIIGVKTIERANKIGQYADAVFMCNRAMRYMGTRDFDKFGRGWFIRLFEVAMKVTQ